MWYALCPWLSMSFYLHSKPELTQDECTQAQNDESLETARAWPEFGPYPAQLGGVCRQDKAINGKLTCLASKDDTIH